MARADLLVITRSSGAPQIEAVVRKYSAAPIFYAQTELQGLFPVASESPSAANSALRAKKFFAFCAIGNPNAFFEDLRRWQISTGGNAAFADHHRYSHQEAAELERRAAEAGADALLCTEKDVFNLTGVQFSRLPVFFCRISLKIADDVGFWRALLATIERKRAKGAP